MAERRLPVGVLAVIPVVIGLGVYAFTGNEPVADPDATPTAGATQTVEATATYDPVALATEQQQEIDTYYTPGPPLAEPTPAAALISHGDFHDGAWVRVNPGVGDCLNARNQPSTSNDWVIVNFCLPDGFEGMITGTTSEAEGHWWWYLAGAGYVAEEWLTYLRDADLDGVETALAGSGRIAFVREGDIWLMDADGGDQRRIFENDGPGDQWSVSGLQWSPDGSMLAFQYYPPPKPDGAQSRAAVRVLTVGIAGDVKHSADFEGYGLDWSPDSTLIGTVLDSNGGGMDGIEGIPGYIDLQTLDTVRLVDRRVYASGPPRFNFDGTLVLMDYSAQEGDTFVGRRVIADLTGRELHRIEQLESTWYSSLRWSPTDNRIAMHVSDADNRPRYAIYDMSEGAIITETERPKASEKIGGKCGSVDMWRGVWSLDGGRFYYSFNDGDTGANGIWAWDIAAGTQTLIPAAQANDVTPADGTQVFFSVWGSSDGFIFGGDARGGTPVLLTEGRSPAWAR